MELTPDNLMHALDVAIMQMNKRQRKVFAFWTKTKIAKYNFNYPEGYRHETKEPTEETD